MSMRNTTTRWGALSQLLHWTIVALIIVQFVLANMAEDLPNGLQKLKILARHKSFGITILALAIIRLLWRRMNPVPTLPAGLKPYERFLARVTHDGLYVLLFAIPLSGWAMSSAKNYHVSWFNQFQLPDFVPVSNPLYEFLLGTHQFLALFVLPAFVALHVGAALKHHFFLKDTVLKRMLPFNKLVVLGFLGASVVATNSSQAAGTFVLDPAKSTLSFSFVQAGASNSGRFTKFSTTLQPGPADAAGGLLSVSVDVASLDTQDKDRDTTLRSADLFDPKRFPAARFVSSAITKLADGRFEARGKLTIRDVSRDVRLPLAVKSATEAGNAVMYLSGKTTLQRLDYGVGQGEWKSTEWVGNEVAVSYDLRLSQAAAPAAPQKAPAPAKTQ
ncbi:MAG TPA: YceI family protein [Steroidobacteraceae bacterium]